MLEAVSVAPLQLALNAVHVLQQHHAQYVLQDIQVLAALTVLLATMLVLDQELL